MTLAPPPAIRLRRAGRSLVAAGVLVCLATQVTAAAPSAVAASAAAPSAAPASGVRVLAEDAAGVTLEATYTLAGLDTVVDRGTTYVRIRPDASGAGSGWGAPGAPEVPVLPAVLGVPAGARPALTVLSVESDPVAWLRPLPVPRSIPRPDGMADERLEPDPAAYAPGVVTPGRWAEIGGIQGLRGLATLAVRFFPVSIEGATGRGAVARRIVVRVDFRGPSAPGGVPGRAPGLPQSFAPTGPLDGIFDAAVLNRRSARAWREPVLPIPKSTGRRPFGASAVNPEWKILVTSTGLVRVPFAALRSDPAHLFPTDVPLAQLVLALRDFDDATLAATETPVAIEVHDANANGVFDGADDFVFYAQDLVSRYGKKDYRENLTRTNVYWLTWSTQGGPRIATVDGWPAMAAPTVPATFTDSVHVEQDRYPLRSWSDPQVEYRDHYLWFGELPLTTEFSTDMPLGPHPTSGTASFTAAFQGISGYGDRLRRNHMALRVQKAPDSVADTLAIATTDFYGSSRYVVQQDVPVSLLGPSSLTLHYSAVYDIGFGEQPGSYGPIDCADLLYPRYYQSDGSALRFTDGGARGPVEFHLAGFADSGIVVFDITDPRLPVRLSLVNRAEQIVAGASVEARVRAVVDGPRVYVAMRSLSVSTLLPDQIEGDAPSTLALDGGAVDWVAITPDSLVTELAPLVGLRAGQGYRTRIALLEDVFDEFSGGVRSEYAIRRYLAVARPAYVLLVGEASEDQLRTNALSSPDVVPTHLQVSTTELVGADNWYACLDSLAGGGVDVTPDVALGRLPVMTSDEVRTVVRKIVDFEGRSDRSPWRERLLLLADDQWSTDYSFGVSYLKRDWEYAFVNAHDAVLAQLTAPGYPLFRPTPVKFYLDSYTDAYRQQWRDSLGITDQTRGPSDRAVRDSCVLTQVKPLLYTQYFSDTLAASQIVFYQGHSNRSVFTHENLLEEYEYTSNICVGFAHHNIRCNMDNFEFPHILFGFGCHVSEFEKPGELDPLVGDAIGEKDLLRSSGGAVATYGSTAFEFAPPNVTLEEEVNRAFFLTPPTGTALEPRLVLGGVLLTAFPSYIAARGYPGFPPNDEQKAVLRYVLMGDPALRLGVAPPSLDVTFNGQPVTDGMRIRSLGTASDSIAARVEDETGIDSLSIAVRETNPAQTLPTTVTSLDVPEIRDRAYHLMAPVALRFGDYTIQVTATGRDRRVATLTLRVSSQVSAEVNGRPYRPDVDRFVPPDVRIRFVIQAPVPIAADSITVTLDGAPLAVAITGADTTWIVTADFAGRPLSIGPHTLAVRFAGYTYAMQLEVAERLALTSLWAYPNPFTGRAGIQYTLTQEADRVSIRVYTLAGRLVCEMPGETHAGLNVVGWDGRDAAGDEVGNGVYVYRVTAFGAANARVEAMGKIARAR